MEMDAILRRNHAAECKRVRPTRALKVSGYFRMAYENKKILRGYPKDFL
jgi:hypothetical protein